MKNEFEIDDKTGKIYEYVRIESYNKTSYEKREVIIDLNKLIPCQCKACPCSTLVLIEELVCAKCWKTHNQDYLFKRITIPNTLKLSHEFVNIKEYNDKVWTLEGWKFK
jgi:hypothetical protein